MVEEMRMTFEDLMAAGVEAQAQNNHNDALWYREFAYYQAYEDQNIVGQARALRDGAASHSKLDQLPQAKLASEESVHILKDFVHTDASAKRELGASYDRLGRVAARICIQKELESGNRHLDRNPSWHMARGWSFIRESEKAERSALASSFGGQWPETVDQYRINMAKDKAVIDGLGVHPERGFAKGMEGVIRATLLGLLSESSYISHSNPDLTRRQRLKEHGRYALAGLYAGALVTGLSVAPLRRTALVRADNLLR